MRRAISILEIKAGLGPRLTFDARERELGGFEHVVILAEIGAARRRYAEERPFKRWIDVGGEAG